MNVHDFDVGLWQYRARPLRTIDGDTFVADLDLGCYVRFEAHIRIAGFNAPERYTPEGPGATARLRLALETPVSTPWPLRVVSTQRETVVDQVHSFERLVCAVYVLHGDGTLQNLTEMLT